MFSTTRRSRFSIGRNLLGDFFFVYTFSPTLGGGGVFNSHDVERGIRRTRRDVEEHEKRWTALPTLSASGTHHVREFLGDVREFRLHISLAFADRRRGPSLFPSSARARAPLALLPLRSPIKRAVDPCSKAPS